MPTMTTTPSSYIHHSLDDAGLSPAQFRIVCHLLRRQGGKESAYPSIDGMAEICRLDRKTVISALAALVARGIVLRVSRHGSTSLYSVQSPEHWHPAQKTPRGAKYTQPNRHPTTQPKRHPRGVAQKTPHEVIQDKIHKERLYIPPVVPHAPYRVNGEVPDMRAPFPKPLLPDGSIDRDTLLSPAYRAARDEHNDRYTTFFASEAA